MLLSLLFEMTPKWSDKYNYFVFWIKLYQITVPGPCLILFPIIYPYCYTEIVLVCPCITRRLQGAELSRTKPYFGDTPSSLPWVSWSSDSLSSLSFKEEHSQDVGRGRWLVIVKRFYQGFSSLFIVRLGGGGYLNDTLRTPLRIEKHETHNQKKEKYSQNMHNVFNFIIND